MTRKRPCLFRDFAWKTRASFSGFRFKVG